MQLDKSIVTHNELMQLHSKHWIFISVLTITVVFFIPGETAYSANAQHSGEMTLTCIRGGNCVSVICIDDRPCNTFQLNSKNSTGFQEFLENKTKDNLFPKQIV